MAPHILRHLRISTFTAKDGTHTDLAQLSKRAHEATAAGDHEKVEQIEGQIDSLAAVIWGLSAEELPEIQRSLAELRG